MFTQAWSWWKWDSWFTKHLGYWLVTRILKSQFTTHTGARNTQEREGWYLQCEAVSVSHHSEGLQKPGYLMPEQWWRTPSLSVGLPILATKDSLSGANVSSVSHVEWTTCLLSAALPAFSSPHTQEDHAAAILGCFLIGITQNKGKAS